MSEPTFTVVTGRENRTVIGVDTLIGTVPAWFYIELQPGEKSLLIKPLGQWLRSISEEAAGNLGEVLHHAEFVFTTSAATVRARGAVHDCETCRAGVQRALRALRENPEEELMVGTLYWAGAAPPPPAQPATGRAAPKPNLQELTHWHEQHPACTCEMDWRSLGRLDGVDMGYGWVRLKDDPKCPEHGDNR